MRSVKRAAGVTRTFPPNDIAAAYALGAIPARFAVERHAWEEPAALTSGAAARATYPFAEAHIEYARGAGRAHSELAGDEDRLVVEATLDPAVGDHLGHRRAGQQPPAQRDRQEHHQPLGQPRLDAGALERRPHLVVVGTAVGQEGRDAGFDGSVEHRGSVAEGR